MTLQQARQLELVKARYGSLMAQGPSKPGPTNSYLNSLMTPAQFPSHQVKHVREKRSALVLTRIESIKRRSTPAHPICFKCGDRGHLAKNCRNALICFLCDQTGHKSTFCIKSFPIQIKSLPLDSEGVAASSSSAMAPPLNRRGSQRGRIPIPSNRPPYRALPPYVRPLMPSDRPPVHPAAQTMPDRPYNGPVTSDARTRPPNTMLQTLPDRPVQRRVPVPPPKPPTPSETVPEMPLPPRNIQPPVLMFHSSPESDQIDREFQLSFLLDDIAGWGPEKVEKALRFAFPPLLWKVAVFDEFIYIIQCPTEEWLTAAVKKKWLKMEDVQFPILRWDTSFNAGRRLTSAWI